MLATVLLVLFYLFAPLLILYLCRRFPFLDKLGAVLIAYVIGLLLGNSGLLSEGSKQCLVLKKVDSFLFNPE